MDQSITLTRSLPIEVSSEIASIETCDFLTPGYIHGYKITFKNNWQISIQYGPMHYADNRSAHYNDIPTSGVWKSQTAEIAIFKPDNSWWTPYFDEYSWVNGDQTMADVIEWCLAIIRGELATPYTPDYELLPSGD